MIVYKRFGLLNTTHHIELKDNVKLVVFPVGKVSRTVQPKIEKELNRMLNLCIIESIEKIY